MDSPDLERLTREIAVRKRLQEALLVFSRAVSAKLSLPAAIDSLTSEVSRLFGTRRVSLWLHDRKARVLTLAGSSDVREHNGGRVLRTEEETPVSRALRSDVPELTGRGASLSVVAPLRGWRRALGVLVIEGQPSELSEDLLVDLAGELARQLSVSIENLQVLEEAIQRHHDNEQMREQVLQAQKLASVGQFVASVAHEMNNPLQGVLGHLELLIGSLPDNAPDRPTLDRIYKDAERASKIVQDLLVFGGSQRVAKLPVDMPPLIRETIVLREATPNRPDVKLVLKVEGDMPAVPGDPALLQQALINMIVNGEQAIADTGRSGRVFITARSEGERAVIEVEDTGPGIPADLLPRIFDPFFTTKEVGKGTGLGLAITFGIVTKHGGTIVAGRSSHGGARFTVRLPTTQ